MPCFDATLQTEHVAKRQAFFSCHKASEAKKQRSIKHVANMLGSTPTIAEFSKVCDMLKESTILTPAARATESIENGRPREGQCCLHPPLAQAWLSLDVPFLSPPPVLITAFSYERHTAQVPLLPTVTAEAEHISVRRRHSEPWWCNNY